MDGHQSNSMETTQTTMNGNHSSSMQSTTRRHMAAIPVPGRGHVNPMLALCRKLSSNQDLLISLILTEEWAQLVSTPTLLPSLQNPNSNLRIATIPNVIPSETERGSHYAAFVEAVLTLMGGPVDRLVAEMEPPVDFIVADLLLPWVAGIGRRRGVHVAAFWPQSASVLLALLELKKLGEEAAKAESNDVLKYLPRASSTHFPDFTTKSKGQSMHATCIQVISWYPLSHSLLFNSFNDLESLSLQTLKSQIHIPMQLIGPLTPQIAQEEITSTENTPYLKWLDSHPKCSVLYISLGSFLNLSHEELRELSLGLSLSDRPFLWAIHGENSLQIVKQYLKGCDKGLVVPWCEQIRVLEHESIGGFLTHCGWNSTIEAVTCGVPMVVYPLMWDQYSNAKMIVEDWRVGFWVKGEIEEQNGVIKGEEVARVVNKLMDLGDCEGMEIRARVKEMKEKCIRVLDGEREGSSVLAMDAFAHDVMYGDSTSGSL